MSQALVHALGLLGSNEASKAACPGLSRSTKHATGLPLPCAVSVCRCLFSAAAGRQQRHSWLILTDCSSLSQAACSLLAVSLLLKETPVLSSFLLCANSSSCAVPTSSSLPSCTATIEITVGPSKRNYWGITSQSVSDVLTTSIITSSSQHRRQAIASISPLQG